MSTRESEEAFLGRSHDPWSLTIRNDFVRALHATLLRLFGVDVARAFWAEHPLERGGALLGERELAQHLWDESNRSPLPWLFGLVATLERFLLERGLDYPTFSEETRRFANRGSFIRARHLMAWLGPLLVPMFRFGDPHRLVLQGARLVSKRMSDGVDFRMLRWRGGASEEARRHTGSIWVTYEGLSEGWIPAWDFVQSPGTDMLAAPRIFGLPPFDSIVAVCDARKPESIPWGPSCTLRGDRFLIDGVTFGRVVTLSTFLDAAGYARADLGAPDTAVVSVERDYRCERRKRVVLAAGCAYGAPGYLSRLSWKPVRSKVRNFLRFAHHEIAGEAGPDEAVFEELQQRYLETVSSVIRVVYFPVDGSVAVGGRHVCRGIPARILRECVKVACEEGRFVFGHREFKRLPELISHPKNTGFEMRLKRLQSALETAGVGLYIRAAGRGRFELVAHGRLTLEAADASVAE